MVKAESAITASYQGTVIRTFEIPSGKHTVAVIETQNDPYLPEGASPIAWYPIGDRTLNPGQQVDIERRETPVGEKGGRQITFEVSPKE